MDTELPRPDEFDADFPGLSQDGELFRLWQETNAEPADELRAQHRIVFMRFYDRLVDNMAINTEYIRALDATDTSLTEELDLMFGEDKNIGALQEFRMQLEQVYRSERPALKAAT